MYSLYAEGKCVCKEYVPGIFLQIHHEYNEI